MGKYKYKVKELSQTGTGSSMTAGSGEQYTGKTAFNPNKKAKGAQNIYYYKLGYKPVPNKIKGSGLEVKHLWEASAEDFQKQRVEAFNKIEQKLNDIYTRISNAKNKTIEYYNDNPSSYSIVYPTDLIFEYINDIETLLNQE